MPCAIVRTAEAPVPEGWARLTIPEISIGERIQPLENGDVVALHPSGRVDTQFRGASQHNSLFVTEQCNSYCVMCSQPPRRVDDIEHLLTINSRTVRLLPPSVGHLGITGGEPTLLGGRLADLLRLCRSVLPTTQVDVLSNGRRLSDWELAARIGGASDERILFTIPLYADNALRHDYVVQAGGAFDETIRGFYNLANAGVRSEVRVVLHRESVSRLPELARFVQKNLPFVEHVAFMGLEMTGLARAHERLLWIEPPEYMPVLAEAVQYLTDLGMPSSIYNVTKCLAPESLWSHLRPSISDWKRVFLPACDACRERPTCGGLFGTSSRLSASIRPLP
ncbi:MAG: His-Xaa-Ser system radical SAM maturase HxsC [Gemmatimonadetes bacterium]|nr:His-Xaa-Ser system radical SAM maturase HxsC [Gemmatimonadota bacterium]